jgi:hypothetical protein
MSFASVVVMWTQSEYESILRLIGGLGPVYEGGQVMTASKAQKSPVDSRRMSVSGLITSLAATSAEIDVWSIGSALLARRVAVDAGIYLILSFSEP